MNKYDLSLYRSWFPFLATGKIWMNHAAVSPMSSRVKGALDHYLYRREIEEIDTFFSTLPIAAALKKNLGALINAPAERIAFVGNTSDGLNVLAAGLQWHPGDRIILNDNEFPSNVLPFINLKRLGVEVDFIKTHHEEITADQIERLITPRTRLVSLSFVQFLSGFRADLKCIGDVCRKHGVLFCVDAIQGLGVSPLDAHAMKIDFISCGGPKWLMGMLGLGFIYVSEETQERIHQSYAGWTSNRNFFGDFFNYRIDFDKTARRYENGTLNLAGIVALCESTTTLLEIGIENIQAHIFELTDPLIEALDEAGIDVVTGREHAQRAGIVTFRCGHADKLFHSLESEKMIVSIREGMIRISPHFYNSAAEVSSLQSAILRHTKSMAA